MLDMFLSPWVYSPVIIILAVMILPTVISIGETALRAVPKEYQEGSLALGATHMQTIFRVTLPAAKSGVLNAFVLSLGRAIGETMAVTMLIGNTNLIPTGLTATGNTMASVIANQFGEADGLKLSSLVAIGLLLFIITAVINLIGRLILRKFR